MATKDKCCTVVPYFKVRPGKLPAFKSLVEQFVGRAETEPKCIYYGYSFDGDEAHCREGYEDAEGVLIHLDNVKSILLEALEISDVLRLEVHGPEEEIAKLRVPLADFKPRFFVLEYGFRRR